MREMGWSFREYMETPAEVISVLIEMLSEEGREWELRRLMLGKKRR